MTKTVYDVFADGLGWTIQNEGKNYTGYKTREGALRAAITLAEKLQLNGFEVEVRTKGPEATWKTEWPTEADPFASFR